MRRKTSSALLTAVLLIIMLLPSVSVPASDEPPSIAAICFNNATIDGKFDESVQEYTITLDDNTASPTLKSYAIKGDANLFINYTYDETNHQTGLTATLQYDAGSRIYNFVYSNPADYAVNGNNTLSSIYSFYGVLSPALNDKDTNYKFYIPSDLTELSITPVTSDINAYCAPVELILSAEQTPKITLTCTASDGNKRDYTLNIKRVDKTVEQVELEMRQPDYVSFVEGTRVFEKPEFIVTACCVAGGIAIMLALFSVTKKYTVNPYDNEEKPFYSSIE